MLDKIKILNNSIKGLRKNYCIVVAIIIIAAMMEAFSIGLIAPLAQNIINNKLPSNNFFYKINTFVLGHSLNAEELIIEILSFLLIVNLFGYAKDLYIRYCEQKLKAMWRIKIYKYYLNMPYNLFAKKKEGVLVNNIINETERGARSISLLLKLMSSAVISLNFIVVLFISAFKLSIGVLFVFVILYFIVKSTLFGYSERVGRKRIKISQDLNSQVAETINGILQIKMFNLQNNRLRNFIRTNDNLVRLITLYVLFRLLPTYGIRIAIYILGAGVFIVNKILHIFTLASVIPTISVFYAVFTRLLGVTSNLVVYQMNVINYFPSLELANSQLDKYRENDFKNKKDKLTIRNNMKVNFNGNIVFKDVYFSYDKYTVFSGLNFTISPRSKIGILGSSGAGKTTLVYLLTKIYMPQKGDIIFNGVSIKEIDSGYIRQNIGVVTQDNFIFSGSIEENITIGMGNVKEDDIIEAAKLANIHDFIMSLEDKYDTFVGERGLKLSGGQKQRLAIARAIVRNPAIFIFDEATNAVDKISEKLIMDAIGKVAQRATVIIISHDLNIIKNCNKIIFLKEGKAVEEGSHYDLLSNKKEYWRIYSQSDYYEKS